MKHDGNRPRSFRRGSHRTLARIRQSSDARGAPGRFRARADSVPVETCGAGIRGRRARVAAMIVAFLRSAARPSAAATAQSGLIAALAHALEVAKIYGVGWILLTTLATAACLILSVRLTARRWSAP
jgi:hypothetical protein